MRLASLAAAPTGVGSAQIMIIQKAGCYSQALLLSISRSLFGSPFRIHLATSCLTWKLDCHKKAAANWIRVSPWQAKFESRVSGLSYWPFSQN